MRYQLILRFQGDTFDAFEDIVELETALLERLGELILLDSRDVGSDECSIVVLTPDPVRAFSGMSPILDRRGLLAGGARPVLPYGRGTRDWENPSP